MIKVTMYKGETIQIMRRRTQPSVGITTVNT